MTTVHAAASADPTVLRVSMDAKATVKLGPFSRRGKSRAEVKAVDHDFKPAGTVTPVARTGAEDELTLCCIRSKVTSDCLVDVLEDWWDENQPRFPLVTTLLVNLDNGPENHSRRTQFLHRMVAFAQQKRVNLRLAYYPPYHSKYNPVERCFGVLERHGNGELLESIDTVLRLARSMTWKGRNPVVHLVTRSYETGIRLTDEAMLAVEAQVQRLPALGKWFVDISCAA